MLQLPGNLFLNLSGFYFSYCLLHPVEAAFLWQTPTFPFSVSQVTIYFKVDVKTEDTHLSVLGPTSAPRQVLNAC